MKQENKTMRRKTPYDDQLVVGLTNIARVLGKHPATLSREAERGEWPCVTIERTMLANRAKLLAAQAAKRKPANETASVNECEDVA
jgi:IS30 family transposase